MRNQKENKYIKIFGRIIFFVFLLSAFSRIFFRDVYSRDTHNYVLSVLLCLAIVHFILKLKYNREGILTNIKARLIDVKRYLPEMVIIGLMLALWFFYKNQNL